MANEKTLDLSTLQAGLKRYDDSLADVAKSGDYNDLVNKPESGIVENFETLKNDITRKGVSQWDLEITTGDSGNVTNENLTTWTIQLTQSMIDIINEKADGNGTLSGVMNYCAVRCVKNHDNQNIESIIKIIRADTSISDLQVGDKIVFTIIGTWIDWDDFWTGVDEKYVGENVSAKITRSDSTLSGWTVEGYYFAQDRITAKKVMADTVGDKDGTLAELRESVSWSIAGCYAVKKAGWVMVGLDGNNLSISGEGSLYATLPEGFRPPRYINGVFFYNAGKIGNCVVDDDGKILLWPNSASDVITVIRAQIIFPT